MNSSSSMPTLVNKKLVKPLQKVLFFLSFPIGGATELRDEKWASFTVKLGWPVQGVFPPGTDGSHVNGVDRSKACDVFASADDYGLVNLYRNPCLEGAKANSYRGHSEHVVRVRFDNSDQRLYSIGGYDRTIMQWRVI